MKEKTKLYLFSIVLLALIISLTVTYAYFTNGLPVEDTSVLKTNSGTLKIDYLGTDSSSVITLSGIYPKDEAWATKTFRITGTNTTSLTMYYKLKLVLDTENTFTGAALSYSLTSVNTSNNGEVVSSSDGHISDFDVVFGTGYFTKGSNLEHNYTLKIYLKDDGSDQNYLQSAKFAAHVAIEDAGAYEASPTGWDDAEDGTLLAGIKANYSEPTSPLTLVGREMSLETEAVMGSTPDDYGTSYYFRGNVENNYVVFAGMCWRILRITGDGAIKLILANYSSTDCTDMTNDLAYARDEDGNILTPKYNESSDDNAYVGFMYGTTSASSYKDAQANINKSTVLMALEEWYTNNLASYESKLADTIWCNDKSTKKVKQGSTFGNILEDGTLEEYTSNYDSFGYFTYATNYGSFLRSFPSYTNSTSDVIYVYSDIPSLVCPSDNAGGKLSKFTAHDTANGNGALDKKIGLITMDELMFSGLRHNLFGDDTSQAFSHFLTTNAAGGYTWTMTPYTFDEGGFVSAGSASVFYYGGNGFIGGSLLDYGTNIRPVISLKNNVTISSGTGTAANPFVVS